MSSRLSLPSDSQRDIRRETRDELDKELDKLTFTHHSQLFEDSPGKSELNQFGDFSGSHSQFDPSGSLERGMANMEKSTDFSFRSKSAMPPMSTLSSLSSRSDSPRKTRSEGGRRSSSINRFSPMSTRKVTALGMHESESEYSPSKYYQPARTPHGASRMNPQSIRKVSPKSFKDTATLFHDLGLEDSVQHANVTTIPPGQSFRLPRDIPDLSTLLSSSRKASHKAIESVAVSEDNQKLFAALQDLQLTIDALEQQNQDAQNELKKLRAEMKRADEKLSSEQQRATFAENELKQHLSQHVKSGTSEAQLTALEARNVTLLNALNAAKKDLENRTVELDLAREEAAGINEERNRAIARLANAHEKIDSLTVENEALRAKVENLMTDLARANKAPSTDRAEKTLDDRISDQVRRQRTTTSSVAESAKPLKKNKVDNDSYSDEGIEVSKSILNDSEIEDLTQEVQATRRRNAREKAMNPKAKPHTKAKKDMVNQKPSKSRTDETQAGRSSRQKVRNSAKPSATKPVRTASHRQHVPLELSEDDDDTFASGEDEIEEEADFSAADVLSESEDEDLGLVSTAEDEPSQILYRRKPTSQARGKVSGASKVNVEKVINELSRHDVAKCTICSRKAATRAKKTRPDAANQRQVSGGLAPGEDPNATIRPSQPPVPALHSVLAGLEDEFRHLKLRYHSLTDDYNRLDPSLGKKKRKALATDLRQTIESLEGKADQIYAIFDVLEAAATGMSWTEDVAPSRPSSQQRTHGSSAAAPLPTNNSSTRREWINT